MLFPKSNVKAYLDELGLTSSDTVMIHADAGVAAQFIYGSSQNPLNAFIGEIIDYFCEGTVIVPSFSYSATKGEVFNPTLTPSDVGTFSEQFRSYTGVLRSLHPIFSVSCIGQKSAMYSATTNDDCFGSNTLFEQLYNENVKILALGCPLNRGLTFIHYVEQSCNVSYRYLKVFPYQINANGLKIFGKVKYFVRDLTINSELNLENFEAKALKLGKLKRHSFGRYYSRLIHARDCFDIASSMINYNPYALIEENITL